MRYRKALNIIILLVMFFLIYPYSTCIAQTPVYRHDLGDVTGNNVYPVYANLEEALNAIGSAHTTLIINKELSVTSTNCTVPSNVHLMFMKGGSLSIGAGKNLVINGPVSAPNSTIFSCADTIIEDCDDAWNEQVITGVTSSADTSDKKVGNASSKLQIADNASVGILASEAIGTLNIKNSTIIKLWIKSNINISYGCLQLLLDDSSNCSSPIITINIPSLTANTWTNLVLYAGDASLLTNIISIGIKQVTDLGSFTLWIDDVKTSLGVKFGAGSVSKVYPEWFLPSGYVKDGTVDYSSYVQMAFDSISSGTIEFPAFPIKANLIIVNKSNYRITGKKGSEIKPTGDYGCAFKLAGVIDNLQIDTISIIGEANSSYHQYAIDNESDHTITNVTIKNLIIKDVNTAISVTADASTSYYNVIISENEISNIIGLGYGIIITRATNCNISNNIIDNCSTHAIYINSCTNANTLVCNNVIKNHRKDAYSNSYATALSICRSSGIIVSNNTFLNCYDGSVEISHSTASQINGDNISLIGNHFINRKNLIPDVFIGEQSVPTSYNTSNLLISNNRFYTDRAICGGGDNLLIFNGINIKISENIFYSYNVNGAALMVEVGHDSFINDTLHCSNVEVSNNSFAADGTDLSNVKGIYICGDMCVNSSKIRVKDNNFKNITYPLYFGSAPTNQNTIFEIKTDVSINLPEISAYSTYDYTISVNGAKPSSIVTINPIGTINSGLVITGFAHSTNNNIVYLRVANVTGNAIDPPNMTFRIKVEDE